jgi:hypothetical protein
MPRDRGLVSECHRHCLNGPVSPCFATEISYVPDVSCESDREGAEDGTRPAWELPYAEFMALTDAVAASCPSWRELFETAAACDLLVTCLLDGDQAMATDVLADRNLSNQMRHQAACVVCGDDVV